MVYIRMDLWGEGIVYCLGGENGGKVSTGRPRRRLVYNIRMDLWGEVVHRVLLEKLGDKGQLG